MQQFNRSGIIVSLVIIIIVAGLGVINIAGVNIPYLGWLEKGFFNILSPVLEYSTGLYNSVKSFWTGLFNANSIIAENEELKKELLKNEQELGFLKSVSLENKRLRELLAFKELVPYEVLGSRVIGYSSSEWEKRIIINSGASDGVRSKMPVITYNGSLVGRVDYVGSTSSQVILLTDPSLVVGGIVQRADSRAIGLVKTSLNSPETGVMENIAWNTESREGDIVTGDIVVTSGLSNSYPRGLPVGRVSAVKKDDYGLTQTAELELFMKLKTIEEVLVITNY